MRFVKSTYTPEEEKEIEDLVFDVLGDYVPMSMVSVNHGHVIVDTYISNKDIRNQLFADFKKRFSETKYSNLGLGLLA